MTDPLEFTIGNILRQQKLTLSIAESCTGGLVSHRITNVAGSSDYYIGGIVAYAYEAKVSLLGVKWETLRAYGAVSRQVVLQMAIGVRLALKTDLALSVSGIAGPAGETDEKPVGTTWIGLADAKQAWARGFYFKGNRLENKCASAEALLQLLLVYLQGDRNLDKELR